MNGYSTAQTKYCASLTLKISGKITVSLKLFVDDAIKESSIHIKTKKNNQQLLFGSNILS